MTDQTVPGSTDTDRLAETAERRRNQHCMNCGDTRGGPIGHETSECTYDSRMAELRAALKPGFMLTLSRLVHDAQQDTHALADAAGSSGPYVVQGCVVYGAQQLKDAVRTVWKQTPALLSLVEQLQGQLGNAEGAIREAVHIAICEDSPEECVEWRGKCVKAAEASARALGLGEEADDA